jgi:signal transduction histidine kinase
MNERHLEPLGIATAVMAWLAIGVVEILGLPGDASPWWWLVYAGYGAAYLWCVVVAPKGTWPVRERVITLTLVAPLGVAVVALSASHGFTSISLVMTAILLGQLLPLRAAVAAIVIQTVVVVGWLWVSISSEGPSYAMSTGVAFLAFQIFALLMVVSVRATEAARHEADRARAEAEEATAALRSAQAQLASTSRAQERLRIARDLHDVVGHQLTALSVNLQVASRTATGPAKDDLEVCRAVASELLRDVRDVVSQLRETPDTGPEFAAELREIGQAVPNPIVHVDVADDLPALGSAEADVVRRCVQEIVTNAVRHSGAASVWIGVEELDGVVSVTARDDGRGVGDSGAEIVAGHGLTGMTERFEALGGSVAWSARPGQGFTLQASLPLRQMAAT